MRLLINLKPTVAVMLFFTLALSANGQQKKWINPLENKSNTSFYDIQKTFRQDWRKKEKKILRETRQSIKEEQLRTKTYTGSEAEAEESGYFQYKRWEYYMAPRVYPSGDISLPSTNWQRFQNYLQENKAARNMYHHNRVSNNARNTTPDQVQSSTWTFMGPTGAPVNGGSGRVNFVRVDPVNNNIIYAGAPDGGIWKTTNGGTSWTTNTDQLSVLGCTDIAIDPVNTQILYAATGDGEAGDSYSIGVLKSTDGGASWNSTGLNFATNQFVLISRLLVNPSNTQLIIAATNAGVYRSTNGGTSWTQPLGFAVKDAEFKPGDPNTVYAVGTSFYKSTDGGTNWTNTATGLPAAAAVSRLAIAVSPANNAYVYILASRPANDFGFQGIYRSVNSGTSFTTQATTPNVLGWASAGNDVGGQGWYTLSIEASPTNAEEVMVGGVNIWRSVNGGVNFTLNAHWTASGAPFVHADIHHLYYASATTVFAASDGGIFKTTNNGATWTDISANMGIAQIYRIGLSASNPALWLTGHQDNGTNLNNGAVYAATLGGDGMDCFIDRTNNNVMYAEFYNGSVNRSTNGGASWGAITAGLSGAAAWVTPWYQDPVAANTIYCGYTDLFKSVNQGTTWTSLTALPASPGGTITDFKVAPSNTQVIYVARSGGIFKTINGGGSWATVTGTLPVASAAITRLAIKDTDPNTLWVTFSGYSAGDKIFKTIDGGTTWTNISTGLPNIPVNCIAYTPNLSADAIYVGCDVGVYYRDNAQSSWQPYFAGLPNARIEDLEVYRPTGKLKAASFGRGVWQVDLFNPGNIAPIPGFSANRQNVCVGQSVNFTDESVFGPTSWSWSFPGGVPATSTAQNPVVTYNTAGTYNATLTATNANGNNVITINNYINVSSVNAPPVIEGFEAAGFPPINWASVNVGSPAFWERYASAGAASTSSMRFDNFNNDVAGSKDELWTPKINAGTLATVSLEFDVAFARYNATLSDTLEVLISSDCGATFNSIYLKGGTTLATAPDFIAGPFIPTSAQWRKETITLNAYANQQNLVVAFRNRGHFGQIIYIDNVRLTGSSVLPLQLLHFAAQKNGNGALMNWVTEQEQHTSHFEIERSYNGLDFSFAGRVNAANTSGRNEYRFTDAQPFAGNAANQNGNVYYRLKMTDRNGSYRNSQVEKLNFSKEAGSITVSPNPFKKQVTVSIQSDANMPMQLQLTDAAGKIHLQETKILVPGLNTITITPETELATGIYILKCTSTQWSKTIRLVRG
jgi:PKD repeat protein